MFTGGPSVTMKSHHNVGGLPDMQLKLVEPLRELFKDEVRSSAGSSACPKLSSAATRFPGPGLGIRCPGEITPRQARHPAAAPTTSIIEEIRRAGLYDEIWQAFAVLLPVRTVGVMRCW